jgi:hypothetical protein
MAYPDKNLNKKFSVPLTFKGGASYAYMYGIHKGQLLTLEEMIIIHRILIGCSKLVYSSHLKGAKNSAKALSKPSTKSLVSISSILKLTSTDKDYANKFRPSDLRRKLPEEIKNVQAADISDILKTHSNLNLVTKTKRDPRKRGSPPRASEGLTSVPGRQSFYQQTEYLKTLKQVIAKPIARKLLFAFLLESKLIHKWLDFHCLFALYQLKFNDMNTSRKIDKAVNVIEDESKIENLNKKASQYDDKKLNEMACSQAKLILQRHKEYEELFTSLYINGGLFFDA